MTSPLQNLKPDFTKGNVLHCERRFEGLKAKNHYQKVKRLHARPAGVLLLIPEFVCATDYAYVYRRGKKNGDGKVFEYFMAIPAPLSHEAETVLRQRIDVFNKAILREEKPCGSDPAWRVVQPLVDGQSDGRTPASIEWDFTNPYASYLHMLACSAQHRFSLDKSAKDIQSGRIVHVPTTADPSLPRRSQAARSG